MNNRVDTPTQVNARRSAGSQGTQLFSAEELRQFASESGQGASGQASVQEPVIEGVSPWLQGRRYLLRQGRQTLGRREDNDIVIDDLSVSASHAWIMNQQGHYVIMNTLSTNGTFVNDKRIHEVTLRHGDRIRLGQVEFVFLTRERGALWAQRLRWAAVIVVTLAALGFLAWRLF